MTTMTSVASTALDYARIIGAAIASNTRRVLRTLHAIIRMTRRHVPKWVAALLTVALLIPGPQDELIVLLVIAGFAAFKPDMRRDIATATREAWTR